MPTIPAYATTGDLVVEPWNIAPVPANAGRLLRAAARLIRAATITAIYNTDADGAPTHPDVVTAFRDASCAQVVAWLAADVDPTAPVTAKPARVAASKSLGSGSVTYADADQLLTERAQLHTTLTREAHAILLDAGLTQQRPQVHG